jgi:HEPN domain-containing protein
MALSRSIEEHTKDIVYKSINDLLDRYLQEGLSIYDIKKYFKKNKNIGDLLNNIGRRYFDDKIKYEKFIKSMLNNTIKDRISDMETNNIKESKIIKYNDYINENIKLDDIDIKLDYLFNDIGHSSEDKDILADYFDTRPDYIESKNDKYFVYNITDFKTNISKNNRIASDAILLADFQIEKMKQNVIKKIISEIYSKIPDEIEYLGIVIKTHTLLNKDKLRESIKKIVKDQDILDIVTKLTNYKFSEKYGDYYIWKHIK